MLHFLEVIQTMFSKIAINNVRRSIKDYTVYFLTLTFAVCIFYSFNSIGSQKLMETLRTGTGSQELQYLIGLVSVFVSFILGGLIVYSNNFLIKKRKKELGIYMTLGMGKSKISRILVFETFLIGLISLGVGLALGFIFSQGLSLFTAKLFGADFSKYQFVISFYAIAKTCLYFGIIFIIVMVFNQFVISKYKLIDLLNAAKKSEDLTVKSPIISFAFFIAAVVLLGVAYRIILKLGLNIEDPKFLLSIILGIMGTLFFFFSLAGFFIFTFQRVKNLYLKKLNIFVLRQINNKVNTNFISISVICLMLFITIILLTTMFGLKTSRDIMLKEHTPFDASAVLYANRDSGQITEIKESFSLLDFKFEEKEKYAFFNAYELDITVRDIFNKHLNSSLMKIIRGGGGQYIMGIGISDYNAMIALKGQGKIELKDNEVLFISNYDGIGAAVKSLYQSNNSFKLVNKQFTLKNSDVIPYDLVTTGAFNKFLYLIVPDDVTKGKNVSISGLNVQFTGDHQRSNEKFSKLFNSFNNQELDTSKYGDLWGSTLEQVNAQDGDRTVIFVFLGVYLGIVFLMASAAVLALQQLSEASESLERYRILKKIGVTEKMINKTIFVQTFIYFVLPLALAVLHSVIGSKVMTDTAYDVLGASIGTPAVLAAFILLIIYGGYFYATYTGVKRIVRNS